MFQPESAVDELDAAGPVADGVDTVMSDMTGFRW